VNADADDYADDYALDAALDAAPSETLDEWLVGKLRCALDAEMRAAGALFEIDMEARSCVVRLPDVPPVEFVRWMAASAILAGAEWVRAARAEKRR